MLIITRLIFTSILSLGLANCALASPIAIDAIYANARENIAGVLDASQSNLPQAEINTSLVGTSNSLQNNQFNTEFVKQKGGKVSKVAEPSSLILLGLGILGLSFLRRRKH